MRIEITTTAMLRVLSRSTMLMVLKQKKIKTISSLRSQRSSLAGEAFIPSFTLKSPMCLLGEKTEVVLCYVSFRPGDESPERTSILIMGTGQGCDVEAERAARCCA